MKCIAASGRDDTHVVTCRISPAGLHSMHEPLCCSAVTNLRTDSSIALSRHIHVACLCGLEKTANRPHLFDVLIVPMFVKGLESTRRLEDFATAQSFEFMIN